MNPNSQNIDELTTKLIAIGEDFGCDGEGFRPHLEQALTAHIQQATLKMAMQCAAELANKDQEITELKATIQQATAEARLIELDLLEQAINDDRNINQYKLQRLTALTQKEQSKQEYRDGAD